MKNAAEISADIFYRIFDPCFSIRKVGKGDDGGLVIAYAVKANKDNGTIRLETIKDSGTTLIFTLPQNVVSS